MTTLTKLGKYHLQQELGRGAMAVVYRGYDPDLGREVAIKVLPSHMASQTDLVARFEREARAVARLKHSHIVTIHDVGHEGDRYYFVMEYLEGLELGDYIQQHGPLPLDEVLNVVRPLASALDYAHHAGVFHRDIKPANIMISAQDGPKLTDFGIARATEEATLTSAGAIVGTPQYMSPEQARGQEALANSDQYSLGIVTYQLLTGKVPFEADSIVGLLYKVTHEAPPPILQVRARFTAARRPGFGAGAGQGASRPLSYSHCLCQRVGASVAGGNTSGAGISIGVANSIST